MNKSRFDYIDIAKGLGILAVVWAHIMLVGWSHEIIYAFHMPFFFFVAGMLYRKEKYTSFIDFLKKRSKRLLVPYFIYAIGSYVLWAGLKYLSHEPWEIILKPLPQILIAQGSGRFMMFNSALWFIPCLFVVEILYYFKTSKDWLNVFLTISCAALSFMLGSAFGEKYWLLLPFNFDAVLIALPFYCLGNILGKNFGHSYLTQIVNHHKYATIILWAVSTILLYVLADKFGVCSMGSSSYHCKGYMFIIRALVGITAIVSFSLIFSDLFKGCKNHCLQSLKYSLIWLGKYSLDVMSLHIPVKGIVILIWAKAMGIETDAITSSFSSSLIVLSVTMLVIVPIILCVNRFLKR